MNAPVQTAEAREIAAMLFLAARGACGVRDRRLDLAVQLHERLDQAGLASPAGGGHDEEVSGVFHGVLLCPIVVAGLFDVLHLLAHLLDQHLHVHRDARHLQHGGLGAQGVGLAVQLLNQEIQAFADVAAFGQQVIQLLQV